MNTQQQAQIDNLKNQTFGVEIEMYGIRRPDAAKLAARYFGTNNSHHGGAAGVYDCYTAKDAQGRDWKFMRDSSIVDANGYKGTSTVCEMVTPILHYEDIELLQGLVREQRHAGAQSNPKHECGVHIHIGAQGMDAHDLLMITNLMASHEDILIEAINVDPARRNWCRTADPRFVTKMNEAKPKTLREVENIWYGTLAPGSGRSQHYNPSRYHMLNLHAFFTKGTIEFRMFQFDNPTEDRKGGLHAGQIKAYIQLCLAMVARAREAKCMSPKQAVKGSQDPHMTMNHWLRAMGLRGEEFATVRHHMKKRIATNHQLAMQAQSAQG